MRISTALENVRPLAHALRIEIVNIFLIVPQEECDRLVSKRNPSKRKIPKDAQSGKVAMSRVAIQGANLYGRVSLSGDGRELRELRS